MNIVTDGNDYEPQSISTWRLRELIQHEKDNAELRQKIAELEAPREGSLLQCIDCRNTESPAGAMARQFNHGRCLHCGGYFKVVRA